MPLKDRVSYNEYQRIYQLNRSRRIWAEVIEFLGGRCAWCGAEDDLKVDHIDWREKSYSVGKLWSYKKEKLLSEVKKCQLLCKSCHKIKTKTDQSEMLIERGLRTWNEVPESAYQHGKPRMKLYRKCTCDPCREAVRKYKQRIVDIDGNPTGH
jgi:5-methylcytosine-specific restriction endonuclease McrA